MRFLTALAALGEGEYLLTGTERLCQRPLGELLEALRQAGVQAVSERGDGCPPVRVTGGLTGGKAQLSGGHQQPVPLGPAVHRAPGAEGP